MQEHGYTLRDLYRTLELPGENPLKRAHSQLDNAVRKAYGMAAKISALEFLFELNQQIAEREATMVPVVGPGLHPSVKNPSAFLTSDRITI